MKNCWCFHLLSIAAISFFTTISSIILLHCPPSRLVGFGEASFISLAAPFIDDNAPAAQVCFVPCLITFGFLVASECASFSSIILKVVLTLCHGSRKLRGLQCFTCAYLLGLRWAMFMVEL